MAVSVSESQANTDLFNHIKIRKKSSVLQSGGVFHHDGSGMKTAASGKQHYQLFLPRV